MKSIYGCIRASLRHSCVWGVFVIGSVASATPLSFAGFTLNNVNADGSVSTPSFFTPGDSTSLDLTGGNNGSGLGGNTDFVWTAPSDGTLQFMWSYTYCSPLDVPIECDSQTYDWTGYQVDQTLTQLTDTDTLGVASPATVQIQAGEVFGWYVGTFDNFGGPGTLSVFATDFTATTVSGAPEPGSLLLSFAGLATMAGAFRLNRWFRRRSE